MERRAVPGSRNLLGWRLRGYGSERLAFEAAKTMLWPVAHSLFYEAIDIYRYILFGAIIASWVAPGSHHPIVVFLNKVTEPVLTPIRKLLPNLGGIDISPIILLFGLSFLQRYI